MIKINRLKDEDLKKLAVDFRSGKVFTDRDVNPSSMIGVIFMPIEFMKLSKRNIEEIGLIYEYTSKAGSRALNGMPMFFSCRILHKKDFPILCEYVEKLEEAEKDVLANK